MDMAQLLITIKLTCFTWMQRSLYNLMLVPARIALSGDIDLKLHFKTFLELQANALV